MAPGTNSHCLVTSHAFRYIHKGPGYFWNGCIVSQTWSARDVGPNITGEFHALDNIATGAFYIPDDWRGWVGSSGVNTHKVDIDASRSSGIYGDSETVQPKAVYLLPCIKF